MLLGLHCVSSSSASLTSMLEVSATLEEICTPSISAPINMNGFDSSLGTPGQTMVTVTCSQFPTSGVSVNFGGGQNWENGQRYMLGATSNYRLAYQLFSDNQPLMPGNDFDMSPSPDRTYGKAISASIPTDPNAKPDFYSDTVTVTFKF
jgi:spore coat protein U-like protein